MEVYMNNMIFKSKTHERHLEDLWEMLNIRKYNLKLNPKSVLLR